ncbi:MAG: LytR/AlgR family response regulator transcription factor [Ginsengibacter sp.]
MNTIRCLIVDDEPYGREILESFAGQISFLDVVDVCEDAFQALEIMKIKPVDLLLSDIQMPKINGLEFVRSLPLPPVIIFVSAHDQYAINSFDLGVADYLLKPVSFERFLKAINKASILIDRQKQLAAIATKENQEHLFIKANNKLNKIFYKEIFYVESTGNYIKIFTSGAPLVFYNKMKWIESLLPPELFVRIHNSYIISINAVKAVDGFMVELENGVSLPLAKARKEALFTALNIKES